MNIPSIDYPDLTEMAQPFSDYDFKLKVDLIADTKALDKSIGLDHELMKVATNCYPLAISQTAFWTAEYLAAIKAGDEGRKMKATQNLVFNPLCLFTAALEANVKLPPQFQVQPTTCLMLANNTLLTSAHKEVQRGKVELKNKGGFRVVIDPGLTLRMAGVAVLRLLTPYVKPRPWQYTRKGTHSAVKAIRAMIGESLKSGEPLLYAARLDISSFFPSHDPVWLVHDLPIPKDLAEYTVIGRHLKVKIEQTSGAKNIIASYDLSLQHLNNLACRGLPQGLATSSLIAMMSISRLKWPAMQGVAMFNLADDFFLLARTETELTKAIPKLQEAVAELPDGQFDLRVKQFGALAKGVDFLGHTFRITEGGLRIGPSYDSLSSIMARLMKLEEAIYGKTGKPTAKGTAEAVELGARYVALLQGWLAAHSACDDLDTRWAAEFIAQMHENLAALGVTLQHAKAAYKPWMAYKHINS
jgi:hypothetical protein